MDDLSTDEVVDKIGVIDVLDGIIVQSGLGEVGERIVSLFIGLIVLVLQREILLVGDTLGIDHKHGQLAELLVVGDVVDTENMGSLRYQRETIGHSDSCHSGCIPPV